MRVPPGSHSFVIFVFYDFLPLVWFCFVLLYLFLDFSWSLFFSSLFLWFVNVIKTYIFVILYSNKGLDVEISSSNKPPHNHMNNLKCVERQRPDDGHYWPKHVVFGPRI